MKTAMKLLPGLIAAVALNSCASAPQPLTSTPPAKALKAQEFSVGDGFLIKKFTFPAGIYRPEMEDKNGFYFSPPGGQIKVFDSGMRYGSNGGIYWKKNESLPGSVFVKGNFGITANLAKKDIPATPVR
jgi:hypothetical protein